MAYLAVDLQLLHACHDVGLVRERVPCLGKHDSYWAFSWERSQSLVIKNVRSGMTNKTLVILMIFGAGDLFHVKHTSI